MLGLAQARALAEMIGAGHCLIPLGPAASHAKLGRAIRDRIRAGTASTNEIARELKCSRSTVEKHRQRLREESQGDLFAPLPQRRAG